MKIILLVLYALCLNAGETDQYISGETELKDSYLLFNNLYNKKINDFIATKEQTTCSKLTDKILSNVIKKVVRLAENSSEIERYPDNSTSNKEYFQQSIYKNVGFPLRFTRLRRTINIGGIYIGIDKLGHFGLVSRNYYRHYLKHLKKGFNEKEAEKRTVVHGIKQEMNILGYRYNGVLSFADLEANYQGLQFAISLCQGKNPYLKIEKGYWVRNQNREFDIRAYINPKMDESYNANFRKPRLWKKITPSIRGIYCALKNNTAYQERITKYKEKERNSSNDQYIREYFKSKPEINRVFQSVNDLCI